MIARREWQLWQCAAPRRSDEAGLVQVALQSEPTCASQLGEVDRYASLVASSVSSDHSPTLGRIATSHINGRAGW
jgi:hypothetical protein